MRGKVPRDDDEDDDDENDNERSGESDVEEIGDERRRREVIWIDVIFLYASVQYLQIPLCVYAI